MITITIAITIMIMIIIIIMNNNSNNNKYDLVPTPRFWKNFIEKGRLKIEQWKI